MQRAAGLDQQAGNSGQASGNHLLAKPIHQIPLLLIENERIVILDCKGMLECIKEFFHGSTASLRSS